MSLSFLSSRTEKIPKGFSLLFLLFIFITISTTVSAQGSLICGEWIIDSTSYDPEMAYPFSDRFGNKYLRSDLILPKSLTPPCDCSEFSDTEVPNLSQSYFDITFFDCVESTGVGFNDLTFGEEYRRVMCKVYAELSQLITQADVPCTEGTPPHVNISVLTSNGSIANSLPSGVYAAGSPMFENSSVGGVLTCSAWDIINGGVDVYSNENEEVAHALVVLNTDPNALTALEGYYTGDNPSAIGDFSYDLYSILLHEAIHTLGFSALMAPNGYPRQGNGTTVPTNISYSLYANYLYVDNSLGTALIPIIEQSSSDPFTWGPALPPSSYYGSCSTTSDPDMYFVNQNSTSVIVYTGSGPNISSFSHLDDNCAGPFVMAPGILNAIRNQISESEKDILCSLGYTISSNLDCGCKVVGVDDYGPACLEPESCVVGTFQFSLCDGEIFTFPQSNLLNNDINADGILNIGIVGGSTLGEISVSDGIVAFEPCGPGQYKIVYEPYSNSCDQLGNATLAYINVKPCITCIFSDEETPVDGGYNHNICNLVCNPEVYANINDMDQSQIGCVCEETFELPGWYSAVGTADFFPNTVFSGSGSLNMVRKLTVNNNTIQESVYTPIDLPKAGKYFYSYYYQVSPNTIPSSIDYSIHSALVDENIQCQFGGCGTLQENSLLDLGIGKVKEIHLESQNSLVGSFTRTGSCFTWDDLWQEKALWIYPDAELTELGTGYQFKIDQIELIPDDFPEDEILNAVCETSVVLGGEMYCQPSGTTVKYTWTDENATVVAMYQVVSDDAGDQTILDMNDDPLAEIPVITCTVTSTATCTLTRIFTDDGGLDLAACNDNTYEVTIDADGANSFGCASCNTSNTIPSGYKLGDAIAGGFLDASPSSTAQAVCIEGTLEIDFDYNFINSQINMLPGSRIVVKEGAYLTLSGTRLAGCTAMWAGIEIEAGAGLKMSNSTISDAQYGLFIHPGTSGGDAAPEVEVVSSTFCDDFIGIFVPVTGNGKINGLINNNIFANYNDLLPTYSGQASASGLPNQNTRSLAGIYLNNLSGFLSLKNDFGGLTSGIVSVNSNVRVSGGIFTEIVENQSYYPGYSSRGKAIHSRATLGHSLDVEGTLIMDCVQGIIANSTPLNAIRNTLLNVDYGIWGNLPAPGGNIIIGGMDEADKNTIEANQLGILVNNAGSGGQVLVGNNEVTLNSTAGGAGIGFIFHGAPAQALHNTILVNQAGVGIFLQATREVTVADNNQITLTDEDLARSGVTLQAAHNCVLRKVHVNGDGTGGSANYGIEILSSPGNKYCCNDLDKTRIGVYVDGGSISEDHFSGTIFGDHYYGLLITSSGILGTQTHQENQWTGVYGGTYGAVYQVPLLQAQDYPFIIDDSQNTYFGAANESPDGWFDFDENPDPIEVCALENCMIDQFQQDSPDTKRIAEDNIQAGDYTSTVKWELNRYLYAKVDGVTITEQEVQDFVDYHDTTTVGAFHTIDQAFGNMFVSDTTETAQIRENLDSIQSILKTIEDLDTALLNATGMTYQTLWQNRAQKIEDLSDYNKDNLSLLETVAITRATNSASIISQNASITVDSIYEENEKTVNGIYGNYLNKGLATPDTTDLNALQAVADQCPLEGGNAVYRARALLSLITEVFPVYDDESGCLANQAFAVPETQRPELAHSAWSIYPNPTTNEVTIDWSTHQFETGMLQIFNLNGKLLKRSSLTAGETKTKINTADLRAGIYLVTLQLDQKQPMTKKLVILHR